MKKNEMQQIDYKTALNQALSEEMERDQNVFLMGEDVGVLGGAFRVSKGLLEKFGKNRIIDTPLSESAIIGYALGAAISGLRPVAEIMFIDFTSVCMDQIINQVAKIRYMSGGQVKVPLVIRTPGGFAKSWAAQHSQSWESFFCHIPGLKVVMPATPYDAKGLLKSAIREDNPVMFIEHKLLYNITGDVPCEEYTVPLGIAEVKRAGADMTIITYSQMTLLSLEAAEILAREGKDVEVIDLRTLDPLDTETVLNSVKKTGRAIVVEEGHKNVGMGAEISSMITEQAFDYLDAPVKRVAALDIPVPFSKVLEDRVRPKLEDILEAARDIMGESNEQ